MADAIAAIAASDENMPVKVLYPEDRANPDGTWRVAEFKAVTYGGFTYLMVETDQSTKANFGVNHFATGQAARAAAL